MPRPTDSTLPRPRPRDAPNAPPPADGLAYSALLKNELLGAGIEKVQDPQTEDRRLQPSTPEHKGLFTVSRGQPGPAGRGVRTCWALVRLLPRLCQLWGAQGLQVPRWRRPLSALSLPQYSLSSKRSSPDDGNDVSPYSLSPVSNKR